MSTSPFLAASVGFAASAIVSHAAACACADAAIAEADSRLRYGRSLAAALVPASEETLGKLSMVHEELLQYEQVSIATEHVLHGGMYTRTIRLEPGIVMLGSLIQRPTVLIVNGSTSVLVGDERVELDGYNVLPGCAGRKQLFVTRGPVEMTMIFATQAKTVEEAENEVFAEADLLMSRRQGDNDTFTITGE